MPAMDGPPKRACTSLAFSTVVLKASSQEMRTQPEIVVCFWVGALHGVAQAIRMISCLNGSLRLCAAIAARLKRRLVPFDLHGATVFYGHPYAAFHLAASPTCGANVSYVGSAGLRLLLFCQRFSRKRCQAGDSSGGCCQLSKCAPRYECGLSHSHTSLLPISWARRSSKVLLLAMNPLILRGVLKIGSGYITWSITS